MIHYSKKILVIIVYLLIAGQHGVAADKVPVVVSIIPQKYFVQQIGKNLVDVQAMVRPGASPATYEPKSRQLVALSKARLYFAVGVPFENIWLNKFAAANPKMKVIHTDSGIDKIPMTAYAHQNDSKKRGRVQPDKAVLGGYPHGHGHHHGDGGRNPHIWLSPPLVKIQARSILAALQEADPSHSAHYKRNFDQFIYHIDQLHARLQQIFAAKQGLRFIVFHPAWGYFARTYGIEEVPIEIEGKAPKPAQLKSLIEYARAEEIKVIFVQPQFSTKSAALVAKEIGGQVTFADPLAEDWFSNLHGIAEKLKAALK